MTIKGVTNAQLDHLKRMAKANGVDRDLFQKGLDEHVFFTALDALKQGARLKLILPLTAPVWGRIHCVGNVPVRLDQDWQTAINEAGPDTPSDYVVRQVGHLYPSTGTGIVSTNLVLVNLNGDHYQDALVWAKQFGLSPASPRHVFALAKHHPNLPAELGMVDPCYIVSPQEVNFRGSARVCGVWFSGRVRWAVAYWVEDVGYRDVWVAFLRE
jgi:hypothetical protein